MSDIFPNPRPQTVELFTYKHGRKTFPINEGLYQLTRGWKLVNSPRVDAEKRKAPGHTGKKKSHAIS